MNNVSWSTDPSFFDFNPYAGENFFKEVTRERDSKNPDAYRRYLIDRRKMTQDFCQNLMCQMSLLETEIQTYFGRKNK